MKNKLLASILLYIGCFCIVNAIFFILGYWITERDINDWFIFNTQLGRFIYIIFFLIKLFITQLLHENSKYRI